MKWKPSAGSAEHAGTPRGPVGRRLVIAASVMLTVGFATTPGHAASAATTVEPGQPVRSCESLTDLRFADGTVVTSASQTTTTPAICNVELLVPQSIHVRVSLPVDTWNGRFQGVGGGGFNGSVPDTETAAKTGYAAAGSDSGHTGSSRDASWAWSPTGMNWSLINDFVSRASHETTAKGKSVTRAFYGTSPGHSYWNGCSNGGREGLSEAQVHPDDYDGILAGAPAIKGDRFLPTAMWPQVVMHELGDFMPSCKFDAFDKAVTAACDGRDGVTDGVITDPRACRFDPTALVGTVTPCGTITAEDAAVVKKIWDGPRRPDGTRLWYGILPGASFSRVTATANGDGAPEPLASGWYTYWLAKDPSFDWHTLTTANFARSFDRSRQEWGPVVGTDNPDLSAFRASGGKLLLWHGLADGLIPPQGTTDYYRQVTAAMGGRAKTERFARLFTAPGVGHCRGGSGAAPADPLAALVKWVEQGEAPTTLLAANGPMSRPLCRWPAVARYDGHGSTNDAANFRCSGRP
ncbi:tannase/feruloyl esterase family alpha/beta hydrolase [Streptomyces sp. NPDC006132]|uniref:tannase/feruloyl esterase family alpha/beta hydrolase n=1 Tax=Streptomyces sp. NPDC006132 TaxID=3156732 RepID=UPI0034073E79